MTDNTAAQCYAFCSLFESEILLRLMLQNWNHPFAEDEAFRNGLLESATELLMTAADESCSQIFIEGLPANEMNFVSAVWYVEWSSAQDDASVERNSRQRWLENVRKSLPSCFCDTELLD